MRSRPDVPPYVGNPKRCRRCLGWGYVSTPDGRATCGLCDGEGMLPDHLVRVPYGGNAPRDPS